MRSFFAFALDAAGERQLAPEVAALRRQLAGLELRWVPARNWHITAEFLGEIDTGEVEQLRALAAAALRPLAATTTVFDRLHWFPGPSRPHSLVLAPADPSALAAIQGALHNALLAQGYSLQSRAYRPHLTLARCKKTLRTGDVLADCAVPAIPVAIEALSLYRSESTAEGQRYTPLFTIALSA